MASSNGRLDEDWSVLAAQLLAGDPEGLVRLEASFARGIRFLLRRSLGSENLEQRVSDVLLRVAQGVQRGELEDPSRLAGCVRTAVRSEVSACLDAEGRSDQQ